jgi:ABC-type transport system involved in multi-copper enzyme maturation permease subunit
MNTSMVMRLIWKDWYFQRRAILLSLGGGALSLGIVRFGGQAGFTIGLVFLVTIMAMIGAMMVMGNVIGERENQTLAFAMSLPISYLEYTASKILSNLLIFVPFWFAVTAGCLGLIVAVPDIHGLFAFTAIMAVEILVSTCMMIAVAIVSESKGWTIAAIMVGNLALNVVGYFVAHIPSIGGAMWKKAVYWNPAATISLAIEFGLILAMLGVAFFLQSRKRDFI